MFLLVFFDELLESGLAVGDDALVAAVVVVPIRADDGQLKMFQKAKKKFQLNVRRKMLQRQLEGFVRQCVKSSLSGWSKVTLPSMLVRLIVNFFINA